MEKSYKMQQNPLSMTGLEPAIFRFEAERVIQLRHMDDLKGLAYTTIFEQQ